MWKNSERSCPVYGHPCRATCVQGWNWVKAEISNPGTIKSDISNLMRLFTHCAAVPLYSALSKKNCASPDPPLSRSRTRSISSSWTWTLLRNPELTRILLIFLCVSVSWSELCNATAWCCVREINQWLKPTAWVRKGSVSEPVLAFISLHLLSSLKWKCQTVILNRDAGCMDLCIFVLTSHWHLRSV